MAYGDKEAKIALIADYLCELDKDDLKRVCGRHGVSLGMMVMMAWNSQPKFGRQMLLKAKLDEATDFSIDQLYETARRSY